MAEESRAVQYLHEALEKFTLKAERSHVIFPNTTSVQNETIYNIIGSNPQAFIFIGDTPFTIECMKGVRLAFPTREDTFTFMLISNASVASVLERMTYFTFSKTLIANTFTTRAVPAFEDISDSSSLAFKYANDTFGLYGAGTELSYAGLEGYMIGRYIVGISELAGLGSTSPPREYYESAAYNTELSLDGFLIGNAPQNCNQLARTVRVSVD